MNGPVHDRHGPERKSKNSQSTTWVEDRQEDKVKNEMRPGILAGEAFVLNNLKRSFGSAGVCINTLAIM